MLTFRRDQPIELRVDSGHHFFFIAIDDLVVEGPELTSQAANLRRDASLLSDDWHDSFDDPWLLYKLWHDPNPLVPRFGLLFCIDTAADLFSDKLELGQSKKFKIPLSLGSEGFKAELEVDLTITSPIVKTPITLYVDFGNTRTMAFLAFGSQFRETGVGRPLPLYPVAFVPRCWTAELWDDMITTTWNRRRNINDVYGTSSPEYEVVESWVLLLEPQFSDLKKPLGKGIFVETSPAVIGGGSSLEGSRYTFMRASLGRSTGVLFQSAPKRIVCDETPTKWRMLVKRPGVPNTKEFGGFVDFQTYETSGSQPAYSRRSDAVVFFALGILEAAGRQMQSRWGDELLGGDCKYLDRVVITHPSCWTEYEIQSLKAAWELASRIYSEQRTRPGRRQLAEPQVVIRLNEALTAQIPYACAEQNALRLGEWLKLYGRGGKNDKRVRVLNVDVGGGTTDLSIITYSLTNGELSARQEFEHSRYRAGDSLVRRLVQQCLFPLYLDILTGKTMVVDPHLREKLVAVLQSHPELDGLLLKAINNGFVPIVHDWLSKASQPQASPNSEDVALISFESRVNQLPQYVKRSLDELAKVAFQRIGHNQVIGKDEFNVMKLHKAELRRAVRSTFESLASLVGLMASAWDCDTVFLSGKVCEIPSVRQLFVGHISMHPSRIFNSKEFHIGEWYPDSHQNRIKDSKSLSAVGLAVADQRLLYVTAAPIGIDEFTWYVSRPGSPKDHIPLEFDADNRCRERVVEDGSLLWRKRRGIADEFLEQVYRLDWVPVNGQTSLTQSDFSPVLTFVRIPNDLQIDPPTTIGEFAPKLVVRRQLEGAFWKDDTNFLWNDFANCL